MGKQPVLAYSIAGIAVAVAITVVAASTFGLTAASGEQGQLAPVAATTAPVGGPLPTRGVLPATSPAARPGANAPDGQGVEYLYVDEPQAARRHGDDDDEREEHRERALTSIFGQLWGGGRDDDD
ncbi:MAG: hypothetical protein EPO16_12065 [Dehalococcoidia bacterium]|nr:MAG: hypothetical protein EPO16_12065 [Dehalococcoidia bacterium]